ncbi:Apoptotic ATPase [Handroanthus impetiginosus]|uniref:Apoptotic ATPase n=1 Tax=Handroanthus impetiginosus TaxID=429701 RepID=A0A2G9IB94_9LAMI|nr:Apoptotic ATPase [Handroanthus impetiginosus]
MLKQILDSFFSKVGEKLVEYGSAILTDKINLKSTLETLEKDLYSLSNKALDIEKTIKKAELSGKKKRKREVKEWLEQIEMIEKQFCTLEREVETKGFLRKFLNGDQATQLSTNVNKLVEQSRHFDELVYACETRGESLLTSNLLGRGIKENLERIEKFLESDKSSIGIYGMGGVGKTALAKHINNIILEKSQEKRVCWIMVSQVFTIKNLQDEIAHFIGLDLSDEYNEDKRAARLHRAIGNNFILILDDVWENICLEKLGDPLRLEGCRLILTTRSFEVCCRMGCQAKVEVKKLHMDEAWNLFKQILEQDSALAPEIEETAKNMAKVCDGLPLGIIVLAGSMRGETSIHVWINELEKLRDPNMVQDDKEDEVSRILKCSYDRLDLNHQQCFLHCSLYPEDFQIAKEELVRRFISEELVNKRKSRHLQVNQGHAILNKLVNVCLLESVDEDCVRMHDLVRAMALKITKRENMVISGFYSLNEIPNEEEWTKDLEKVSLMNNGITEIPGISPKCPNLKTLILHWNPLTFLPDKFFSHMHNLCFLDFSHTNIEKLPNSLSNLENLKALNLTSCEQLVDIPNLRKLKKLRELDLSRTAIKKVPQGMEELDNLRCLSMSATKFLDILPKGLLLHFPYLQCLHLPYQIKAPVEEIARLKHLEEFWGRVKNVSGFNEYIRSRQGQMSTIFYIIMVYGGVYKDFKRFFTGKDNRRNKLNIRQCDLKNGTEEDSIMLVHNIQFLKLEECEGLSNSFFDDLPRLNNLNSLEVLEISKCGGIERILTNEQFLTANQEFELRFLSLRTLEKIILSELHDFIGLIQNIGATVASALPQEAIFSSLRSLSIFKCNKMRKLGLPLLEFQNLEEIYIYNCDEIEEIIAVREGEGEGRGERRVISLPKFKELYLYDLPRLKSICNTAMFCSSIKTIQLIKCQELEKLPLYFDPTSPSPPQTLKEIWVGEGDEEWWESLEWEHPTHNHLLRQLVKFAG